MKPILFTWIPKTAGSSLYTLFKQKFGMRLFLDGQYYQFDNKGSVTFGHASVKDLIKAKIISQEYWDSALCLTVVRHPYYRFLSLYEDFKRSQRIAPHTDRKSTRLNSSHVKISYAVFCLKKKI